VKHAGRGHDHQRLKAEATVGPAEDDNECIIFDGALSDPNDVVVVINASKSHEWVLFWFWVSLLWRTHMNIEASDKA
jgi:hypothetical protein